MNFRFKIEKNILYIRNIIDTDSDFEMIPLDKIHFIGKVVKQTIPQEHKPFSAEKAFVYLFLIGLPQGTITVPTIPFTNEENRNVQESICHLRNARKVLAEAMELFHGGIMIDKPKEFKLNGANKKTSKENIEI